MVTTVYVETPISYLTEGEKYRPHVHFSTYNEKPKNGIMRCIP